MAAIDRIENIRGRDDIVGIDFVFVSEDQQTLLVFFHPNATLHAEQILGVPGIAIRSSASGWRVVPVYPDPNLPPAWVTISDAVVLRV